MKENKTGIIYVMSSVVTGVVKIGKTTDFENRMNYLEKHGYCNVAGLKRKFAIKVEEYDEKEKLLHNIFSKSRLSETELFALDIDLVIQLLSSFEGIQIYPKDKDKEQVFRDATENTEKIKDVDENFIDNNKKFRNKETLLELDGKMFYLTRRSRDINVNGILLIKDGNCIVKKGSICSPTYVKKVENNCKIRKLKDNVLQEDIVCESVSKAANIVLGSSADGWREWKDDRGNTLNYYREKATN